MSSKSDGNQVNNSTSTTSIAFKESPRENTKEDIEANKFNGNSSFQNNTNTHLATFSQPQTSKACQVEDNKNASLKALSFTSTPARQFNVNTTVYKMQPPTLPQQQYPTSQPLPISSRASSSMVGRYCDFQFITLLLVFTL